MPFDKVETQVDFPAQERTILAFWDSICAFAKLLDKNKNGPRWSFLDGPITANNPMGVHHAWGRTYKDAYQRYHAMLGQHLRYQNGFDCQGLWVEVEVEKELKLASKRDIENLVSGDVFASIDRFVKLCKERVDKFARVQTEQSIRLGYWMDWDRSDADWAKPPDERKSYFTMSEENNYTIWTFLKKCHSRGLLYRGYDAMPWCGRCGVGISQQEMNEGYRVVAHKSVFLRLPLRDRPGENLLVWTTTPWTLTSNVGAAVNPELTYLKVKQGDQVYYVGKGAFSARRKEDEFKDKSQWVEGVPKLKPLEQLFKEKKGGFEIVGEVKGADMVGWTYDGPFDELPAQQHAHGYPDLIARVVKQQNWAPAVSGKEAHRVVAWKDVSEAEGTGIVHIAPGCGKEDFGLGKEQGLPPIAPLGEDGIYVDGFGPLTGRNAVDPDVAEWVLNNLQEKGVLFATEKYPHRYPHCWRCKTELLYRLVDEWFISMDWRQEIMDIVQKIRWIPEDGEKKELDWLKNMSDWMISKKRFWGLALPIWVDDELREFEVIGSREELKARAVEGWPEFDGHTPHRPWIDKVKIRSEKTGKLLSRIPDVGNPWLDAGIVPYSTMGYNRDRADWEKWFPADFITECFPGQFRNWFYALLAMSTMMENREPFKVLLGHGLVRDQKGEEMHKAKGNSIPFQGAADEGYKLFHDRDPKVKPEAQAHKDLPEDWLKDSVKEETLTIDNRPRLVVSAMYPPMGADVMRWVYCRNNPTQNINFGPVTAAETRSRLVMKLWNTYAFFCNYARPDGFDPTAPQVPVEDRPDIDRWILSDLQLLIKKARACFEDFNVMSFCLEAERFVDDMVSNWYVRRNRKRFWSKNAELNPEQARDKLAAYQTLYTVLMTLTKMFAPIMPFITETMYQNLKAGADNRESVHLSHYPVVDESLIDEHLSEDMDSLLDLVSLGLGARQQAKVNVRRPLAELKVQPGTQAEINALRRFSDQIKDELNIKKITPHDGSNGTLLREDVKPNRKTLGPKFGARLGEVLAVLAACDPAKLAAAVAKGEPFDLTLLVHPAKLSQTLTTSIILVPEDLIVEQKAPDGWIPAIAEKTQMLLDTRVTEELKREGLAREVVRRVQDTRKNADLEMEDHIVLCLSTDDGALAQAIEDHRSYIAVQCQVDEWVIPDVVDSRFYQESVEIEGAKLEIALRKA
jgi:isoleucyl-tRNA synthetase